MRRPIARSGLRLSLREREEISRGLRAGESLRTIAARLRHDYPDEQEMWVSHETIYQSLFVQGRGALRAELRRCLRSGRAQRRGRARADRRGEMPDMVLISERPAEVEDRAVPGRWEGDLVIGRNQNRPSAHSSSDKRATSCSSPCPTGAPPKPSVTPSSSAS